MGVTTPHRRRLAGLIVILCLLGLGLLIRFVQLNIFDHSFLQKQSQAHIQRVMTLPAPRGMIVDRLGFPLAASLPAFNICADPLHWQATPAQGSQLARLLHRSVATLNTDITQYRRHQRRFLYLARAVTSNVAQQVRALRIPGVFFQASTRRVYPLGAAAAQLIGLTNIDGQGQSGLELAYQSWLRGQPGRALITQDRLGHAITAPVILQRSHVGHRLQLALDHRIQQVAFQALQAAVKKNQALSGSVVVLDAKTGAVVAMTNVPSYSPHQRPPDQDGRYRNRAVTDTFEPGSVFKPFVIALALASGRYTPDDTIRTAPGWMRVDNYTIRDDLDYGTVNLTQILQKSSNIGAAKILMSLHPRVYWQLLSDFGFGHRTRSGFPGEVSGILPYHTVWRPSVVATAAYGYGVSVTTLQLAHAYLLLADGGHYLPVSFLVQPTSPAHASTVIPPQVARQIVTMLTQVVAPGGTGTRAAISGYSVAGKTGTAYIAHKGVYDHHHHMASFVGMAPVDHPQFVVAVVIRDPQRHHFGGLAAAPAFATIMAAALSDWHVPVDPWLIKHNKEITVYPWLIKHS